MKHKRNNNFKRKHKILFLIFLFIAAFIAIDIWISANVLSISNYNISSDKIKNKFKIVLLSDLHNHEFGKSNEKLINKVKEQKPDMIAIVGDMINFDDDFDDSHALFLLLSKLNEIAPVYYSLGNHELLNKDITAICNQIEETGATVLNDRTTTVKINNNDITILGLTNYIYEGDSMSIQEKYTNLMNEFCNSKNYKILLCHYPEYSNWFFSKDGYYVAYETKITYEYNFDLMLSGHTHGGLVRIPFLGGLTAPNQENWFPDYTKGMYDVTGGKYPYKMIVCAGLGNNYSIPRFNNPPDISVIDITP